MSAGVFTLRAALSVTLLLAPGTARADRLTRPATQPSQVVQNKEFGFTLKATDALMPEKPRVARQKAFLVSGAEGEADAFRESVALSIEAETKGELDPLWKAFRASMAKQGLKVLEEQRTTLGGLPAYRAVYAHPLKLADHTLRVKAILWFTVRRNQVWTLDARGEERRFEWLEKQAAEVEKSLKWDA